MEDTTLVKTFRRLSQGSKQSVQSGLELDNFDKYMHVDRPIDKAVRKAMDDIRQEGGGILLLVGSAGDGKSHMISTLQKDYALSLQKNTTQSHKLQNDQGKTMIAKDSFVPLL